ncbi:toprim domain-containing protein [Bartonella sp. AU18XJBT]|uniref:toprim domain-containing protein n=1 Tax=Bartonella sp. AU18XJBT TaxID=3019089 RepID=UPI0023600657|nr:toprim domain-containing protein [Bartonella sp. AU18XJBT]
MSTIFEIKQKLISQADRIAEMLLPQGHKRGNNWIVGNTRGEAGQSLSICLSGNKAGLWYDFAEGTGGDLLDLWCEVKGISLSQALEEARAALNLTRPKPFMVPHRSYRRPPVPKGQTPQNLVKNYLHKERHIPLEVIKRYRIGENGDKIIFPFYKPNGTLALVKERLAQAGAKTKPTSSQCEPILFGWQALCPTNHAPQHTSQQAPQQASQHTPSTNPTATHTPQQAPQQASQQAPQHTASTNHTATHTSQQAPQHTASTNHTATHIPQQTPQHTPSTNPTSTHSPQQAPQYTASTNPTATHIPQHTPSTNPSATHIPQQAPQHTPQQASQHTASTDHASTNASQHVPLMECAPFPTLSSTNRTIVITEGEIDALSLAAYGYPAVSVPFGGGSGGKHNWIENEFDHLESFETIFLATDMDQPGEEAAHEIASRLGRHRCYRVRLPRKDANDCLTAGIDRATIKAAFSSAQSFAPEGLRRASDYKDQVIGLFWPEPEKHLGYTVPYPKLKDKLHFRPAELTLWSGASGAGKSQLLSDCIPHWIAQNSRLCLASLEMKGEQSLRRLTKQTGGLEQPTKETIERILHFLDDGLILYEHVGKSNVDTLLDVFDYCRARYGCDQFIIDSLMRLGIASDDYAKQEQAVYKMVDWAVLNNVHIHLVAHARKGGLDKDIPSTEDIKGASEIGANAFNIITIWRNRSLEDKIFAASLAQEKADLAKRPGVIMNIAKQRSGDFEGKVGLWFDPQTYRYRCSFEQSFPRRYL